MPSEDAIEKDPRRIIVEELQEQMRVHGREVGRLLLEEGRQFHSPVVLYELSQQSLVGDRITKLLRQKQR